MTESLEDLLTKLKNLRVQEEIVIQKIDHALQQSRLQEESVIKQIEDLTEKHSKKSNLKTPATASVPETTKARVLQPASDRKKRVLDFKTDFKRGFPILSCGAERPATGGLPSWLEAAARKEKRGATLGIITRFVSHIVLCLMAAIL